MDDSNTTLVKDDAQTGGKTISLSGFFDPAFNGQKIQAPTASPGNTNNNPANSSAENNNAKAGANIVTPLNNSKKEEVKAEATKQESNQVKPVAGTNDAAKNPETKQKEESDENSVTSSSGNLENGDLGSLIQQDVLDEEALEEVIKEGYIPKIVAAVINYALNKKVSDVHIEPQTKTLRIRCRVDGVLVDVAKTSLSLHPPIVSRIKILSKLKIDETRIPQDGRFEVSFRHRAVDVRVSSLPTVHGEKIVLRILDKSQKILSLEDLGMQGSAFEKTMQSMTRPWGIILSTGPTGSGKSTTLNAIINRLNLPGKNIVTLEDPVEYETPGVNQCQVKPDIGFTFASGLRSVLRQDPNIIMVGEIRDAETAGMATHAALTGHLVLTTLHTNDTAGSLPRLINMGVEPFLITSAVDLIIAQRLIRLICPKCKEEAKLPPKLLEEIKAELDKISPNNEKDKALIPKEMKFYYGKGCPECSAGFKGRIGIFEVMSMSPEIEDLAIAKRPANELKESALKGGMITMKQDGIIKALQGLTTIDEVYQATMEN
ncbi:MAG: GspE/PulE family protein [Patescibacteria group bacterium]|nr:GspE/PulE family protein [Patescibacteria group bacterium]